MTRELDGGLPGLRHRLPEADDRARVQDRVAELAVAGIVDRQRGARAAVYVDRPVERGERLRPRDLVIEASLSTPVVRVPPISVASICEAADTVADSARTGMTRAETSARSAPEVDRAVPRPRLDRGGELRTQDVGGVVAGARVEVEFDGGSGRDGDHDLELS